jgi:hypothetical protein
MGPLGRADGLLVGSEFVGAKGVAGEAVFDALDAETGEDGAEDGALGLADLGDIDSEPEKGAVAEDDASRPVIREFNPGEVAKPFQEFEDADKTVIAGEGEEMALRGLHLFVDDSREGAVERLGGFAADGGEEGDGKARVELREEAFAAGGEPEDVARTPGAFADPGEGDDALGL